jgi:mRNA interferase MazF
MRRGDIVTVAVAGDYGKPRPAVIIQANWLDDTDSVLVCQITSTERDILAYRLKVEPDVGTGLRGISYVMADKIFAVKRLKSRAVIGGFPDVVMVRLDEILAVVIGLAG